MGGIEQPALPGSAHPSPALHCPPPHRTAACYNRKGQFAEAIEDYNLALSKDQLPRRQGLRGMHFSASGGGGGAGGGSSGGASLLESSSGAPTPGGPGFAAHHFSGFPVSSSGPLSTPGRPASAGPVLGGGGGAPPSPMAGLRKGSFRVGASE